MFFTRTRAHFEHMGYYSTLAGPVKDTQRATDYRVKFGSVGGNDDTFSRYWTHVVSYGALVLAIAFAAMLFAPSNWIVFQQPDTATRIENWIMLGCLALLQVFSIAGTLSAARATMKAKDPVPVAAPKLIRAAFATTRAPGEPIEMVETTLKAAKRVQNIGGTVDVWLLDETRDEKLQEICRDLNVHYFSRKGIPQWNTAKPAKYGVFARIGNTIIKAATFGKTALPVLPVPNPYFAAKSKHGNFNAWLQFLQLHGYQYDILAGVDTDQVPEPNYLERVLGYFRDPNVAFVVGPQVYGNYRAGLKGLVARWAESQASFFQSTIQRAGNATRSAMFVGTNYAVRMDALQQVGGFQPCITEDMATGLAIHAEKNPVTGKRWESVYTPDVLAIGEGPESWGPYFTQQWRWAAGTFDTWKKMVVKLLFRLPPKVMLHYILMLTYYPMAALTWLLAVSSSLIFLTTGATAIIAPWNQFLSLYLMSLVMQLSLYFWNRRYNVSPHEPNGSYGVAGMAISSLTAPVYLSAMVGMALGKKPHFVVTSKGGGENTDWFGSFRIHLTWAAVMILGLIYGITRHHNHPAMLIWAGSLLGLCLAPVVLGMTLAIPARLKSFTARKQLFVQGVQHA